MIGGNGDVGRAAADQAQNGPEYAAHGSDLLAALITCGGQCIVAPARVWLVATVINNAVTILDSGLPGSLPRHRHCLWLPAFQNPSLAASLAMGIAGAGNSGTLVATLFAPRLAQAFG